MSSTLMLSSALKSTKKYHNLISVRVTGVSCAESIADYILWQQFFLLNLLFIIS